MLVNGGERLNIWLRLKNRYDYAEFATSCTSVGLLPHDPMEFAQKIGIISVALVSYPDLSPSEAYIKFVQEANQPKPVSNIQPPVVSIVSNTTPLPEIQTIVKKCGSCGGGRVL